MCGIFGYLALTQNPFPNLELPAALNSIAHRGPDGSGQHEAFPIWLGHRRLSIIDLESGKQPLANEDTTVWITFNGEIYNYTELRERLQGLGHRFKTGSDTETIVHAWEQWGPECVNQLRGMFAFAIWDSNKQELFLARDRLGIKPLVYAKTPDAIAFASEIQALTKLSSIERKISLTALDKYLHYQYIPAPETIFQSIQKLPPAHFLHVKLGKPIPEPVEYWRLRFEANHAPTEKQWIELLDERLEETVRAHLVSDVPFGAFLSGGLDSSTVVAYMSRILKDPVEAFCIGHPDTNYDERQWAMEAAEATGANFNFQQASIDNLEILPQLISHYGEPFADSSAIPTWLVSQFARTKVKMVLSGDGGDELFAGYHAYPAILYDCRKPRSPLLFAKYQAGKLLRKLHLRPAVAGLGELKYRRTGLFSHEERTSLWRKEFCHITNLTRQDFNARLKHAQHRHPLDTLQAFDIENYLPYDNLTKVDIASMCHGLEVRVPLLDHKFLEFVATIPPSLRLYNAIAEDRDLESLSNPYACTGKYLPKLNGARFYSETFLHRPKKGFEVPIQSWLGNLGDNDINTSLFRPFSNADRYFEKDLTSELMRRASLDKVSSWKAWEFVVLNYFLSQLN